MASSTLNPSPSRESSSLRVRQVRKPCLAALAFAPHLVDHDEVSILVHDVKRDLLRLGLLYDQ